MRKMCAEADWRTAGKGRGSTVSCWLRGGWIRGERRGKGGGGFRACPLTFASHRLSRGNVTQRPPTIWARGRRPGGVRPSGRRNRRANGPRTHRAKRARGQRPPRQGSEGPGAAGVGWVREGWVGWGGGGLGRMEGWVRRLGREGGLGGFVLKQAGGTFPHKYFSGFAEWQG